MKFIIDRSKWRAGRDGLNSCGLGQTSLFNRYGFMCCLGQTCKQSGFSDSDIADRGSPESLNLIINVFTKTCPITGRAINTRLSEIAMSINDNGMITREEREQKLKSLFSKFKHKITFVGEYVDSEFSKR